LAIRLKDQRLVEAPLVESVPAPTPMELVGPGETPIEDEVLAPPVAPAPIDEDPVEEDPVEEEPPAVLEPEVEGTEPTVALTSEPAPPAARARRARSWRALSAAVAPAPVADEPLAVADGLEVIPVAEPDPVAEPIAEPPTEPAVGAAAPAAPPTVEPAPAPIWAWAGRTAIMASAEAQRKSRMELSSEVSPLQGYSKRGP
jgi:hypothetical protein